MATDLIVLFVFFSSSGLLVSFMWFSCARCRLTYLQYVNIQHSMAPRNFRQTSTNPTTLRMCSMSSYRRELATAGPLYTRPEPTSSYFSGSRSGFLRKIARILCPLSRPTPVPASVLWGF